MADPGPGRLVVGAAALGMPYGLPDPATGAPRRLTDEEVEAIIREAYESGVKAFDTAPAYGVSEERLGRALAGRGVVWTKLDASMMANGDAAPAARQSLSRSLDRLQRTRVDLIQWHNWSVATGRDPRFRETWAVLANDPRCQALGASTYGAEDAVAAVESGLFAVVQIEWNLLNQAALRAAGPPARQRGVRLAARSVFLQGVLTDRGDALPVHLNGLSPLRARAVALASRLSMSVTTLALRAATEHPFLDHVLVGIDAPGQIGQHTAAASNRTNLPWAEIEALHADSSLTDPRLWAAR